MSTRSMLSSRLARTAAIAGLGLFAAAATTVPDAQADHSVKFTMVRSQNLPKRCAP
jgi:hypothetical protein